MSDTTTPEMKLSNPVRKVLAGKASKEDLTTIKAAIAELENRLDEPHKCKMATLETVPKNYMATGRVTLPALGGLALPKEVGFHAYVDVEFSDGTDDDGKIFTPSRESVTERLRALADKHHPGHLGVVLCDVSVLPAGWQ